MTATNGAASIPLDQILAEGNIRSFRFDTEGARQLVASVRSIGVIEPVIVVPLGGKSNGHRYQLVAGFRRYSAACEAGLDRIPAVIKSGLDDAQILEIRLVENLQRLDMNPIEEARAVKEFSSKTRLNQEGVGNRIGRSGAWVSLRLGLLDLPNDVQERLADGRLSVAHGNALIPYATRDPRLIRQAAAAAEQLSIGPWRTNLKRIMEPVTSTGLTWPSGRARRDLCLCSCGCCVNARSAGHVGGSL